MSAGEPARTVPLNPDIEGSQPIATGKRKLLENDPELLMAWCAKSIVLRYRTFVLLITYVLKVLPTNIGTNRPFLNNENNNRLLIVL